MNLKKHFLEESHDVSQKFEIAQIDEMMKNFQIILKKENSLKVPGNGGSKEKFQIEEKKDGCTCGKPLKPKQIGSNFCKFEPVCICGKDGKEIVKKGGKYDNIHGFSN